MGSSPTQLSTLTEEDDAALSTGRENAEGSGRQARARELKMWIHALRAFFNPRNHPFPETNPTDLLKHDWAHELRIAREALLRSSQLAFNLIHSEPSDRPFFGDAEGAFSLDDSTSAKAADEIEGELEDDSLYAAASLLGSACELCESLTTSPSVSLHAWSNLAETLSYILEQVDNSKALRDLASSQIALNIPAPLLAITRQNIKPAALGADILHIFSSIFELLEYLGEVEKSLRRDRALKQTLAIFTLVREKADALVSFIRTRAMLTEGLDKNLSETLDSMNYATRMELRKVFAHELVDMSQLRQAPAIFIKVENANGLLRDSFRQSAIGLAQSFNPAIEGVQLFDAFQIKLEQSLQLRQDLWRLLQLIRRVEKKPEVGLTGQLMKKLVEFHEGSLRFLMFKDWESCERFMEEVGAARNAAELGPICHRFAAYLEALSSQVNMRAVLLDHPFDYPELEEE